MKNPPVLQSAGIGFAARDEKDTASVAAAQQQDRVRSGFRNIVAQFNLISRQRQRQFSGGDGGEDSCVAGGTSVLLGCCSGIAPALLRRCERVGPLGIPRTTVVHPLYNRCTRLIPALGIGAAHMGTSASLRCFHRAPEWYRLHRRGRSSHYMRGAGISVRGACARVETD